MMHYSRSGEELAHEDAERPEVDRAVVPLVQDDLGGDVLGSATERPGLAPHRDPLREAKVNHLKQTGFEFGAKSSLNPSSTCLDVAPGVEEEVLGLEVPVDDAAAVQAMIIINIIIK